MAGKARVHELAKELGVTSKEVLARLNEQGEFVKSASSTVEAPVARRLRESFGGGKPAPEKGAAKAPAKSLDKALDKAISKSAGNGEQLARLLSLSMPVEPSLPPRAPRLRRQKHLHPGRPHGRPPPLRGSRERRPPPSRPANGRPIPA